MHPERFKGIRILCLAVAFACSGGFQPLLAQNKGRDKSDYYLKPAGEPIVARSFVLGGPARAINVGNPGGVHYCFDAELPRVAMAWSGDFLDIGPDRGYGNDRGGRHAIPLGEPFPVGDLGFPIRVGGRMPTSVEFLGYRIKPSVTFHYRLDDAVKVSQSIEPAPAGVGLTYHFNILGAGEAVSLHFNSAVVNFESDKGQIRDGVLLLSSDEARDFHLTLYPRKNR